MSTKPTSPLAQIAVVGMAARFPGAKNLDEFWQLVTSHGDVVKEFPSMIFDLSPHYDADPKSVDKSYTNKAATLDSIKAFDPGFFNIMSKEAEILDPLQRLVLEETWHALEDAGMSKEAMLNTVGGIILGNTRSEYFDLLRRHNIPYEPTTFIDNLVACIPGRVAHFLDLKGPVLSVDTSCSSSLTAIHLAIDQLLLGKSDWMICGGTNLILSETLFVATSKAKILSPQGKCKVFDGQADGTVLGEGIGIIILKRLADAERDKDRIYGVIQASEINHDGYTNGLGAPNRKSQVALQAGIYQRYGINPRSISYVEAHGTGTTVGDYVELMALNESFKQFSSDIQYSALSSIKSKFGHCMGASGVAGMMKALLALSHKQMPMAHHYEIPNPYLDLATSPFYIPTETKPWHHAIETPRRAAINSFGISGTNVHMVLEEWVPTDRGPSTPLSYFPVIFSAKRAKELPLICQTFLGWLTLNPEAKIEDISFTLTKGRTQFRHRVGMVVDNRASLIKRLTDYLALGQAPEIPQNIPGLLSTKMTEFLEGKQVDWQPFFEGESCHIIQLPHYPFQKEIYWAPDKHKIVQALIPTHNLAPSLSWVKNRKSDLELQPDWPFVSHHKVGHVPILAGAIQLGLVLDFLSGFHHLNMGLSISDIHFLQPIKIEAATQLSVAFDQTETGQFVTFSKSGTSDMLSKMHVDFHNIEKNNQTLASFDIENAKGQILSIADMYRIAQSYELELGEKYRCMTALEVGEGWVKSRIIRHQSGDAEPHALSFVIDAAFQTAGALFIETEQALFLPAQVNSITIYPNTDSTEFDCTVIQKSRHAHEVIVDLVIKEAQSQNLIALIKGLRLATLIRPVSPSTALVQTWIPVEAKESQLSDRSVIDLNFEAGLTPDFWESLATPALINIQLLQQDVITQAQEGLGYLAKLCQLAIKIKKSAPIDLLFIFPDHPQYYPMGYAIGGFGRSFYKETSSLRIYSVFSAQKMADIKATVSKHFIHFLPGCYRITDDFQIEQQVSEPCLIPDLSSTLNLSKKRLLITGGLGGVGKLLIEHLCRQEQAQVVVIGRSELSNENKGWIKQLEDTWATQILYIQADVTNKDQLEQIIKKISPIHGVFHLAGTVQDKRLIQKSMSECHSVWAPKLLGVDYLDELTKHEPLDCFVVFSSISALFGNIGQCDYASANAFMAGYMVYREFLRQSGERQGVSKSMAWPLWEYGGMQPDPRWLKKAEAHYKTKLSLTTHAGLKWFDTLLRMPTISVGVLAGDFVRISDSDPFMQVQKEQPAAEEKETLALKPWLLSQVHEMFFELFKLKPETLALESEIEELGLDSIAVVDFVDVFNAKFNIELNPAVFFTYKTVGDLIDYLLREFSSQISIYVHQKNARKG